MSIILLPFSSIYLVSVAGEMLGEIRLNLSRIFINFSSLVYQSLIIAIVIYRRVERVSSSHLLASNLGFVPVNSLQATNTSFRVSPNAVLSNKTNLDNKSQPTSIQARRVASGDRRIPGTYGVGGTVDASSLIPSFLSPLDATLVQEVDSQLLADQRSFATLFVFYVKKGQTDLSDVIANMVRPPLISFAS